MLFGSPRFAASVLDARQSIEVQQAADHMLDSLGGTVSVLVQSSHALDEHAAEHDAGAPATSAASASSGQRISTVAVILCISVH